MICSGCKHEGEDFIRVHTSGVNNYIRNVGVRELEIYFDILICPECGNIQVDVKTIKTKSVQGLWD